MHLRAAVGAVLLLGLGPLAPAARAEDLAVLVHQALTGSPSVSDRAVERLRYLGPDRAGPPLRLALQSEDEQAREVAASALGIVRDQAAVQLLMRALADDFWQVRRNAVQSLGLLRARASAAALDRLARKEPHPKVRKALVSALPQVGATATLTWLAVHDQDLEVRLGSLDAVARTLDAAGVPKLRPLLQDSSGFVRFAAARALAWLGDGSGRTYLEQHLGTGELEERRRAALALADVPKSWAVAALARTLSQPDPTLARVAAVGLAKRGDRRGLRKVARIALTDGPDAAEAKYALDQLGVSPGDRTALALEDP